MSLAKIGRDWYPKTATVAYRLLVQESGECISKRENKPNFTRRGSHGPRCHWKVGMHSIMLAQGWRERSTKRDASRRLITRMNNSNIDNIIAESDQVIKSNINYFWI